MWVAVALLACGLAVYGNALPNPFVLDDKLVILPDPRVAELDLRGLLTREYWPGEHGNELYRPLASLSFALNWAISHEPWAFRLPNLLIHVAAALGVFLLTRALAGAVWPALLAGLLFVVHPIHTTPLNQIVDRADLGAASGVLLAAWLYVRDADPSRASAWWRPTLAVVLFAGGLACKESAVTLLGVVPLLDLARTRHQTNRKPVAWFGRRLWRCYLPLIAVLLAYLVARGAVLSGVAREAAEIRPLDNIIAQPEYGLQPGESRLLARWGTPLAVFGKAAGLLVWPKSLSWDYSYAAIDSVRTGRDPRLWGGIAALLLSLGALVVSWRRRRLAFAAIGTTLATYSVVSNTVVPIGSVFAERYLYLPSAGFCMLVGMWSGAAIRTLPVAARRWHSTLAAVGLIAVAAIGICYSARTVRRNLDFRSETILNANDLRANPDSSRLWAAVAGNALDAGDYEAAIRHATRATEIYPESPTAWRILGLAQLGAHNPDQALAFLLKSVSHGGADSEVAVVAIAQILKARGSYADAIAILEEFVASHEHAPVARNSLAWYLITAEPVELRDPRRALPHAERAVALEPTAGDFLDTYVSVLLALGRTEDATRVLRERLPGIPEDDPYRAELLERLNGP